MFGVRADPFQEEAESSVTKPRDKFLISKKQLPASAQQWFDTWEKNQLEMSRKQVQTAIPEIAATESVASMVDSQIQEDIKFYQPLINYVTPFFAMAALQLSDFASFLMKEEGISLALPVTILLYNKFSGQIIGMRR